MNTDALRRELDTIGSDIRLFYYDSTDSTNTRAREYAREHPLDRTPTLFVADSQSGGRGRRGRSFYSEGGCGIYMSLLLYPEERGADSTRITAAAAVALCRAIESLTGMSPNIKWVNDLYSESRKLAGILAEAEMSSNGEISYLVLGMGINVYKTSYPDEIRDIATSIEEACGVRISREALTAAATHETLKILNDLSSDKIYHEYKRRMLLIGSTITVIKPKESYTAQLEGITESFSLLVNRDGITEELSSGEVSTKI